MNITTWARPELRLTMAKLKSVKSVIFMFLIVVLCSALSVVEGFGEAGDSRCFNMTMACKDDSCLCGCENVEIPPTYEVSCPIEQRAVKIHFVPRDYAVIECSTINDEYNRIPHMEIGKIEKVMIKGCKLPEGSSLLAVLKRLGIDSVRSLFLANERKDFPNSLIKDHFRGLNDINRLSISAARQSELPDNLFEEVPDLKWLELKNSKIERMKNALSKLVKLESLEITGTSLTQLEEGTFENLTNLQTLSLWSNKLEKITKEDFRGLSSLLLLDLLNNKIDRLDADAFSHLEKLTQINLNKNLFTTLPEGLFSNNHNLREVRLIYNNISVLPPALFANITELRFVYLSSSGIQTVPDDLFANSSNISNITLSDNRIEELPDTIFRDLVNLERLVVRYNALTSLGQDLLMNCRKLRHLDLSFNDIDSIPR